MANPNQKTAAGQQWDEAEIEQALKRLGELHHQASPTLSMSSQNRLLTASSRQMRNLRSTIPRAMEPLSIHASPESAFSALQETTKSAYSEIKEYKQAATNTETVKVLEHAKQSRKDNPKGIKPWRARDDPDWLTTNS